MTTTRLPKSRARRVATIAAGLTLLIGACSSDDGSGSTDAGAPASPLAEFLGQGDFINDPEAAQARAIEDERARQEIIAECMGEQGFEYTPVDQSQFMAVSAEAEEWGSEEWVAKWGFGITTQYFSQDQVGPDLIGFDESRFETEAEEFVDPNQDYVESLSESERDAYFEALHGQDPLEGMMDESLSEEEMEAQMEDFRWEPQGCEGEAYAENNNSMSFYMDFQDEMQEMQERIESDPRVVERRRQISDCVADKGHEYESMEKLYERFYADLEELSASIDHGEPPMISEEEAAGMSQAELRELYSPPELSDEAKAELAELQAEELDLAAAVTDCDGGFDAEYEIMADIRAEYEQEFLDTHADELEQYRAET